MHFCQSQFESFLPEDSSCILESDLDTLSSSRLLQLQLNITRQKAALLAAQKKLSRCNWGKCNRSKWVRDSLQPFIFLCPLSLNPFVFSALAVTPCFSTPGPHLWLPLIYPRSSLLFVLSLAARTRSVCLSNWSQPL